MKSLLNIITFYSIFSILTLASQSGPESSPEDADGVASTPEPIHPVIAIFQNQGFEQIPQATTMGELFTHLAQIPTTGLYTEQDYTPDREIAEAKLNQLRLAHTAATHSDLPATKAGPAPEAPRTPQLTLTILQVTRVPDTPSAPSTPQTCSSEAMFGDDDLSSHDRADGRGDRDTRKDTAKQTTTTSIPRLRPGITSPLKLPFALPPMVPTARVKVPIVGSFEELQTLIMPILKRHRRAHVTTVFDLDDVVVLHERGFLRSVFTKSRQLSDPDDAGYLFFFLVRQAFENEDFESFAAKLLEYKLRQGDKMKTWLDATPEADFFQRNFGESFRNLLKRSLFSAPYKRKYGGYRLLMLLKQYLIAHGKLQYDVIDKQTGRVMATIRTYSRLMALTKTCTGYIEGSLSKGQLQTFFHIKTEQIHDQGISFDDILRDGAIVPPLADTQQAHNASGVFVLPSTPLTPRPRVLSARGETRFSKVCRIRSSSHSKIPIGAESPVIYKGIAFTSSMRKGEMLRIISQQFFRRQIRSLVFVDDSGANLADVGDACHKLGIAYYPVLFALPATIVDDMRLDIAALQIALSYLSAMLILGEDGAKDDIVRYNLVAGAQVLPDGTVTHDGKVVVGAVVTEDGRIFQREILTKAKVITKDTVMVAGEPVEGARVSEDGTITRDGKQIEGAVLVKADTIMQGTQIIKGFHIEHDEEIIIRNGNFVWTGYDEVGHFINNADAIADAKTMADIDSILNPALGTTPASAS